MIRTIAAACLLAALAGPALAETPLPPAKPADCPALAQARAQARAAAAPLAYNVFDLDGENARSFQQSQDVPVKDQAEHVTVIVNPKTGRAAALTSGGPGCAFDNAFEVLTPPYTKPIDGALNLLRLAR